MTQPDQATPSPDPTIAPKRGRSGTRILKWIVIVVLLLIVIAAAVVYFSLNSIVRSTVQTQATNSLGVQTTLGAANVSLFTGNLGLHDLEISSPSGFQAPRMFTVGGTHVDVSYGELRKDPMHVGEINIDSPKLVIEQSSGKINFKALMEQMPKTPEQPQENKPPIKLIIDKLRVNNASVVIRPGDIPGIAGVTGVKLPQEFTVAIPSIEMNNVGSGEGNQNGAAIKDVVMQVITALAAKAADSDQLPPELKQLLNLNINDVAAKMGEQFKQKIEQAAGDITKKLPGNVGNVVQDLTKNPQEITKDPGKTIQQGIGGLLGGGTTSENAPATQPSKAPRKR